MTTIIKPNSDAVMGDADAMGKAASRMPGTPQAATYIAASRILEALATVLQNQERAAGAEKVLLYQWVLTDGAVLELYRVPRGG